MNALTGAAISRIHECVIERGQAYWAAHPHLRQVIVENLNRFDRTGNDELIDRIEHNILLHYAEKLVLGLAEPAELATFLREQIDLGDSLKMVKKNQAAPTAVLLAACHFGAVELIAPALALAHLPVVGALKFATGHFADGMRARAAAMQASGLFGPVDFVEIGKPGSVAALEMAAVLRRQQVLLGVFDERTAYSSPVELFGKKVWGGAGLERIIRFSNVPVAVYSAMMVRQSGGRYQLELCQQNESGSSIINGFYAHLERTLDHYIEQWYFLHEEIAFVR